MILLMTTAMISADIHHFPNQFCLLLVTELAFGQLGLGGSSGGYSSHGYTSRASLRAYGAQLGGLASHLTGSAGGTCP